MYEWQKNKLEGPFLRQIVRIQHCLRPLLLVTSLVRFILRSDERYLSYSRFIQGFPEKFSHLRGREKYNIHNSFKNK